MPSTWIEAQMLAEVAEHLPDCLAWVTSCYGAPTHLQFGPYSLSSTSGVQQGDPLAGHLFGLTLQPVVEQITTEVPTLDACVFFHDDGDAVGDLQDLGQVVDIMVKEGPRRGLILSTASTVTPPSLPDTSV